MDVAAVKVYSVARSTIKSTSQVVGLRDRVAIIRAMLHAISSTQPYAGYGDLIGVGRRRNLSEAACAPVAEGVTRFQYLGFDLFSSRLISI